MMRPKGIWVAICMILVIGIFSTDYVKKRTEEGTASLPIASVSGDSSMGDSVALGMSEGFPAPKENHGEAERQKEEKTALLSGEEGVVAEEPRKKEEQSQENLALIRLQELDEQLARNQSRTPDTTTNSQKALTENEWRLWETELQRILGVLKEKLDTEDQESLMHQQIEWMKNREEEAVDASHKQMGSSMEEVNYNRCRAEFTRARAYELAQDYYQFFTDGLQQ